MKISIKAVIIWGLVILATFSIVGYVIGYSYGFEKCKEQKTIIVHTEFDIKPEEPEGEPYYPFLKKEISDYICSLSKELQIDSDLVVAHLMVENPTFDPEAIHKNENGTFDCGMFQLSDKWTYITFLPAFWDIDIEFDIFNWKHNTFIACHLIKDLNDSLKVQDDAIMAYNCGIGRVMNNTVPESTKRYLSSVKNNLIMLKNIQHY